MTRGIRQLPIIGLLMAFAGFSVPTWASTVLFRTDAQLIAQSERIVHARVVAQRSVRAELPADVARPAEAGRMQAGRIYTVTTLAVIEDLTGQEGDTLDVWELGGTIGSDVFYVGGAVDYLLGQEVLVCLDRGPRGFRSMAMGFSKFDVIRTLGRPAMLRRNMVDTMVVGGAVSAQERSLDEFRQLAAQVLGHQARRSSADPAPETSFVEPWTKLGGEPGIRWRDADFGIPVRVFRNTNAPAPVIAGDGVAEIQTAAAAWTNPTTASIILQYAGTALESNTDGGWVTIPEHSTLISFEDPNDELGGLVLAIGGGHATSSSGGTVGGTTYHGFTNGYIIFQNAADLDLPFRESLNFGRVVTHELGHTIGFGHTQNDGSVVNPTANIMFASCCFSDTPVPPAIGPDDRLALNTIYPQAPLTGPTMALDKTLLRFAAAMAGTTFATQTSTQTVRLTQSGAGTVTWTATASRPWLQVTPASGTGPATLAIAVAPDGLLPLAGSADGAIIFTFSGASNAPGPITVRLTLSAMGTTIGPFGSVDTPSDNTTGVTGAVPFTGWALDDIEVVNVHICRAAVAGEPVFPDSRCAGLPQVFVGSGLFVDGARPDVQSAFAAYPLSNRGGWGFMVLTNMLPGQGNGTYQFSIYAEDRESRFGVLGTRTLTCDNAHATKPFGTIDTPSQGGTASGSSYYNFGWVLTPQPKIIPTSGSTIAVLVDGVSRGTATYNNERADIEALFPGYRNTEGPNGAVGYRAINTTGLTNGLHTISWVVTDSAGASEGIGSRFFMVANGAASSLLSAPEAHAAIDETAVADVGAAPLQTTPIAGRRGWADDTASRSYAPSSSGRILVRGEEVDRLELSLGGGEGEGARWAGYSRIGRELAPLPPGSRVSDEGTFTWAPGAGFVGTYDLVFVRRAGARALARREVRILLQPKTSGLVGTQVAIDLPRAGQTVAQPFMVGGWAADLSAVDDTGVGALHVWAYPLSGAPPIFLGAATSGGARPDVAAVHGESRRDSGFGLIVDGLPPGSYDLAVFPWSTATGDFGPAKVVRITVQR